MYIWLSFLLADEPIAIITKSRGNVKYKTYSEKKFRSSALVNTPIFHGNEIITKAKSFTKIVYLDDLSMVSTYPKTEIIINGIIEDRMVRKQVDLQSGIVRIEASKQIISEFKLQTPHSELTCHQCDFWIISDIKDGDHFYIISGDGFITNPSINKTIKLENDSTIISHRDAIMEISQTTKAANQFLGLLMLDADEMSEMSNDELEMTNQIIDRANTTKSNVVEIRLKNALKMERRIILTYTK